MTDPTGPDIKRFGGKERPKAHEFELTTFLDDGGTNTHKFSLIPIIPAGKVTALMDALDDAPERMFGMVSRLLARVLDDTDGITASWSYEPYADPREGDDDYDPDDERLFWADPDGEVHSVDEPGARDLFEDITNGSSRRRWVALMDPDNEDEAVQLGDMMDLAKWVVGLAVDRPTKARPSSTGTRKPRR
jgi:hypothetical protein